MDGRTRSQPVPQAALACGGQGGVPDGAQGRAVHSLAEAMQADAQVRWVGAGHDLAYPPVPFPPQRVFQIAGEACLRALVRRHHELLRASAVGALFPADERLFSEGAERAADFAVEACGGPAAYSPLQGHTCMRTRHLPFTIDEAGRALWLQLLRQAMDEVGLPDAVRADYWTWVEAMSIRMINRRTTKAQPARWPWAAAGPGE